MSLINILRAPRQINNSSNMGEIGDQRCLRANTIVVPAQNSLF